MTEQLLLDELRQQLIDLQSQLAFQEDTLQALNAIVTRQQQQIDNLNELCRDQKNQLDALSAGSGGAAEDLPPPHY